MHRDETASAQAEFRLQSATAIRQPPGKLHAPPALHCAGALSSTRSRLPLPMLQGLSLVQMGPQLALQKLTALLSGIPLVPNMHQP